MIDFVGEIGRVWEDEPVGFLLLIGYLLFMVVAKFLRQLQMRQEAARYRWLDDNPVEFGRIRSYIGPCNSTCPAAFNRMPAIAVNCTADPEMVLDRMRADGYALSPAPWTMTADSSNE